MKKFLTWFFFIAVVLVAFLIYWYYFNSYSTGNRTGMLQKFSKKGNIFKTYEGELILSSISSTKDVTLASEKFLFTVIDDSIATILNNYEGKMLVVQYDEKRKTLPWRGDTRYIVNGVDIVE
jgi:hypothetical protein